VFVGALRRFDDPVAPRNDEARDEQNEEQHDEQGTNTAVLMIRGSADQKEKAIKKRVGPHFAIPPLPRSAYRA
jgi:hypothetical protein